MIDSGLTTEQAALGLAQYGANEPAPPQRSAALRAFLHFCANPLVLLLLAASIISGALGQVADSALIALMVVLSIALNFWQTYRSEHAIRRLRAGVAPTASVLRDGVWSERARRELVPGDRIRLCAGDLVPADARLLVSRDLHVQQAALTGESMPAEKEVTSDDTDQSADAPGRVFAGTSVVSGTAEALVTGTGPATMFGAIAERLVKPAPETEFERGTRELGGLIMKSVIFLVLFIVLVSVSLHRDPFSSLLFAVALAVGLTPEFLPMITTVTLSRGAVRMSRAHVIVKNLAAIQNFGSIDILCSDKTGTLTAGTTVLAGSLSPDGTPSETALRYGALNARHQTGIRSPLDQAILTGYAPDGDGYVKTDELPFDFERRRVSVVLEKAGAFLLVTKGAPESVLALCDAWELDGVTRSLDDDGRASSDALFQRLCADGLRVLAVAVRTVDRGQGLGKGDEAGMTLVGFLTFTDPPLDGVAESLARLRSDGVEVKILTGDNELVTRHLCGAVGLSVDRILLGSEIERLTDSALAHLAEETAVFARVSPAQKNRIITALRARRHVVGFIGDGVNDAPSLRNADVGISVASAVDIAKDAADIILLQPGLDVLHTGIAEGRRAYGNILKYLLMGTSSNFGNMLSMAVASLFLPFLPMLPTQILLNNFLYDLAQVTIPTDRVDPSYTLQPHRWDIRGIRSFMLWIGPLSSIFDLFTFWMLLRVFHATETQFHTGWFVESLATQTLVLFVIRTAGRPWAARPSLALTLTTLGAVLVGVALPFTPLAGRLGFVPLPAQFYGFVAGATATYLILVELVKRRLVKRLFT